MLRMLSLIILILFFVITIFSTSYDVHLLINGKETSFSSIGEFWFALSPTSLQIGEAVVSRYLDPCSLFISLECDPLLWHPIISSFLLMPSTPTLIMISIFLFWIYRRNINQKFLMPQKKLFVEYQRFQIASFSFFLLFVFLIVFFF